MKKLTRNLGLIVAWLEGKKRKALLDQGYVRCGRCGKEITGDMTVSLPPAPQRPAAHATVLGVYPALRIIMCTGATCGGRSRHGRLRVERGSFGVRVFVQVTDSDLIHEITGARENSAYVIDLTPPQS